MIKFRRRICINKKLWKLTNLFSRTECFFVGTYPANWIYHHSYEFDRHTSNFHFHLSHHNLIACAIFCLFVCLFIYPFREIITVPTHPIQFSASNHPPDPSVPVIITTDRSIRENKQKETQKKEKNKHVCVYAVQTNIFFQRQRGRRPEILLSNSGDPVVIPVSRRCPLSFCVFTWFDIWFCGTKKKEIRRSILIYLWDLFRRHWCASSKLILLCTRTNCEPLIDGDNFKRTLAPLVSVHKFLWHGFRRKPSVNCTAICPQLFRFSLARYLQKKN